MEEQQKKVHICPHEGCGATFSRPYRVTDHLYSVHTKVKAYACKEEGCDKSYSNKSHLIRHINVTHKKIQSDVLYSCTICLKSFVNRQNLKKHMNAKHLSKKYFSCDFCKVDFKKKTQIKAHMFQHTGIKSFRCDLCPEKQFVTLYDKKRHMKWHKTYECHACNLTFDAWSKFQKHNKSVHTVREFICNECNRSFKQRTHIIRHCKLHFDTQITPLYKCPYENCQRFYTRNSNLKQHILVKHVVLRHECEVCKALLSSKAVLNKHMRIHTEPPKEKKKPKTRETGRKERKDKGIPKSSTALKLAGCTVILEVDEDQHLTF